MLLDLSEHKVLTVRITHCAVSGELWEDFVSTLFSGHSFSSVVAPFKVMDAKRIPQNGVDFLPQSTQNSTPPPKSSQGPAAEGTVVARRAANWIIYILGFVAALGATSCPPDLGPFELRPPGDTTVPPHLGPAKLQAPGSADLDLLKFSGPHLDSIDSPGLTWIYLYSNGLPQFHWIVNKACAAHIPDVWKHMSRKCNLHQQSAPPHRQVVARVQRKRDG